MDHAKNRHDPYTFVRMKQQNNKAQKIEY
ncbi:hypothetical protein NDO71_orf040 [Klebsiella phage vB_KpnM_NDO71]|nr:hypothetical protein NDO71_orf040 [Klebsiella phage vB_KpnM_NDO71]